MQGNHSTQISWSSATRPPATPQQPPATPSNPQQPFDVISWTSCVCVLCHQWCHQFWLECNVKDNDTLSTCVARVISILVRGIRSPLHFQFLLSSLLNCLLPSSPPPLIPSSSPSLLPSPSHPADLEVCSLRGGLCQPTDHAEWRVPPTVWDRCLLPQTSNHPWTKQRHLQKQVGSPHTLIPSHSHITTNVPPPPMCILPFSSSLTPSSPHTLVPSHPHPLTLSHYH